MSAILKHFMYIPFMVGPDGRWYGDPTAICDSPNGSLVIDPKDVSCPACLKDIGGLL